MRTLHGSLQCPLKVRMDELRIRTQLMHLPQSAAVLSFWGSGVLEIRHMSSRRSVGMPSVTGHCTICVLCVNDSSMSGSSAAGAIAAAQGNAPANLSAAAPPRHAAVRPPSAPPAASAPRVSGEGFGNPLAHAQFPGHNVSWKDLLAAAKVTTGDHLTGAQACIQQVAVCALRRAS